MKQLASVCCNSIWNVGLPSPILLFWLNRASLTNEALMKMGAERQHSRTAEWQNCIMAKWQNGRTTEESNGSTGVNE